jgi:hypothetical protein
MMTTQRLISQRLSMQSDAPWVWQELERRLASKDLTKQEVNDAVNELAAYMKQTKPGGWNQPFSWQRNFLQAANNAGMISEDTLIALCEAFYGSRGVWEPVVGPHRARRRTALDGEARAA